jgi:hypothetical protein
MSAGVFHFFMVPQFIQFNTEQVTEHAKNFRNSCYLSEIVELHSQRQKVTQDIASYDVVLSGQLRYHKYTNCS